MGRIIDNLKAMLFRDCINRLYVAGVPKAMCSYNGGCVRRNCILNLLRINVEGVLRNVNKHRLTPFPYQAAGRGNVTKWSRDDFAGYFQCSKRKLNGYGTVCEI